jgi:hypothetical protein
VSLLLLFVNSGTKPHAAGSAVGAAGATGQASGSRQVVTGLAAASAGALDASVGSRGATGTGAGVAGASFLVTSSRNIDGLFASVAGAYARGIGGRGVFDGSAYAVGGPYALAKARALRVGTPVLMLTRVVLSLDPSDVAFTKVGDSGPFPLLLAIGTLRIAARAGHISGIGTTESTNVTVSLDNTGGRAAEIVGRPLRVQAQIYDGPDLFFTGTVASIQYGRTVDLLIQA